MNEKNIFGVTWVDVCEATSGFCVADKLCILVIFGLKAFHKKDNGNSSWVSWRLK